MNTKPTATTKHNDHQFNRRGLLAALGATAAVGLPTVAGCSTEDVQDAVDSIDTDTLETAALALRGYALVSFAVGPRVVTMPAPGVRVLAVFLVVSGVATKLAIEYLDVELRKRYVEEALDAEEAKRLEQDLTVQFNLENGESESVALGPNQYPNEESTSAVG